MRSKPSAQQIRYREYFQGLIDEVRGEHGFRGTQNASFRNICGFPTGFKGIRYNTRFLGEGRIRVNLFIEMDDPVENESVFDSLIEEKSDIESEFGDQLVWERHEGRSFCIIARYRDGNIDDEQWARCAEGQNTPNILFRQNIFCGVGGTDNQIYLW